MGRIVRTVQAAEDLLDIWRYLAIDKANVVAADKLVRHIDELLQLLSEQPLIGTRQDAFRESMRSFSLGNYVLFYEPIADGVLLIRVLHGARRFEGLFGS